MKHNSFALRKKKEVSVQKDLIFLFNKAEEENTIYMWQ